MSVLQETSESLISDAAVWRVSQHGAARRIAITASHGLRPRALRRALNFIETHLTERFTLSDLATSVGVSRFHFARLFRTSTGISPMHYLMSVRVERSKTLLVQDACSICEVAALLGFCDQSHFTRTFRRLTGMAPSEYIQRSKTMRDLVA